MAGGKPPIISGGEKMGLESNQSQILFLLPFKAVMATTVDVASVTKAHLHLKIVLSESSPVAGINNVLSSS